MDGSHLKELQKGRFGHAGLLDESHGIGEVVHIVAVHVQHHGLGELGKQDWSCLEGGRTLSCDA